MTYSESFDPVFQDLVSRYPQLVCIRDDLYKAFSAIAESYSNGGKMYICGNGGSASDAEHIIGELMQPFKKDRPLPESYRKKLETTFPNKAEYFSKHLKGALPCFSLVSQSAFCSAYINDHAPDMVYAQLIYGLGKKNDILLGISTSGSSTNVVNALQVADSLDMKTVLLTSQKLQNAPCSNCICICVPGTECCPVQELHLPVYHALCEILEKYFF